MIDNSIIKVENVSKSFRLPLEKNSSIKSAVINFYRRNKSYEIQEVLNGISFEIQKGQFYGIVGRNGSGKSTLLKLLAGIYNTSGGNIIVNGKITPFIELGVGFSPELSGRENVFLNGALLGFNRKEMLSMYNDIVSFAELEKFMDQKLKNYSSGMQVRLAFSIAVRAKGDILLLDEVLAVGDAAFQKKCYDYFMQLKKDKRTVVLVTHDMGAVRQYCDMAIMIDKGKIINEGKPEIIAQSYQNLFSEEFEVSDMDKYSDKHESWGNGKMTIKDVKLSKNKNNIILDSSFVVNNKIPAPIYGFTVFDSSGNNILENNTLRKGFKTDSLKEGSIVKISWQIPNIFKNGRYSISVACCDQSAVEYYEWLNEATYFRINKSTTTAGLIDPEVEIQTYKIEEGKSDK